MTADSSAVVAVLSDWHPLHRVALAALADVVALPAHAAIESYSVLTRLPSGLHALGPEAASALRARFGAPPLRLSDLARDRLLETFAVAGVTGGACYDGLVGLEAAAHGQVLLTGDPRAAGTYGRLGVAFELLA